QSGGKLEARIGNDDVIAALGDQRHLVTGFECQLTRADAGGDDGAVARYGARIGRDGGEPGAVEAEAGGARRLVRSAAADQEIMEGAAVRAGSVTWPPSSMCMPRR